jgi:hypothetical protein
MGQMKNSFKILIGKTEGKMPHGGRRCRWENKIIEGLRGIMWEGVDWIHLAQCRVQWQAVVNTVMKPSVP